MDPASHCNADQHAFSRSVCMQMSLQTSILTDATLIGAAQMSCTTSMRDRVVTAFYMHVQQCFLSCQLYTSGVPGDVLASANHFAMCVVDGKVASMYTT